MVKKSAAATLRTQRGIKRKQLDTEAGKNSDNRAQKGKLNVCGQSGEEMHAAHKAIHKTGQSSDGFGMKKIHAKIPYEAVQGKKTYRNQIELLRRRVNLLVGEDRLLMTMYLDNGNSFRQLARLAGVKEARIARRIHKITKRLTEGEYIHCLRNRDKFSQAELNIAKDYFLLGLSINKITCKQRCTYYRVRKTLKKIQQLIKVEDSVISKG